MRIQLVGLGNVGRGLLELMEDEKELISSRGLDVKVVSVSDSEGTAIDEGGLSPLDVLKHKKLGWKTFNKFVEGFSALDAIKEIKSDVVVELTPSTPSGEPGLSHIRTALMARKNVVTSNKSPLVVAYGELVKTARNKHVHLLYEATVAAHVPVFCLTCSCFKVDELLKVEGILNATTNFIIGEMEKGRSFQDALKEAIRAGWAETDYRDDIDGLDAARKVVILANSLFDQDARLEDVRVKGIVDIEPMIREAQKSNRRIKLISEISRNRNKLNMIVEPRQISIDDPLATVNQGNMGVKFTFKTSREIFVSAEFNGCRQTAYAVLNDIAKIQSLS
jgi:homoserine dehydrogenase